MVNTTILGYATAIMQTRLNFFFDASNIPSSDTTGATMNIVGS